MKPEKYQPGDCADQGVKRPPELSVQAQKPSCRQNEGERPCRCIGNDARQQYSKAEREDHVFGTGGGGGGGGGGIVGFGVVCPPGPGMVLLLL